MTFLFRENAATKTAGVQLPYHFGGTHTVALHDGQESLLNSRPERVNLGRHLKVWLQNRVTFFLSSENNVL